MLFRPFEAGIVDYEKGWMVGMTAALFFRSDFAKKVKFLKNCKNIFATMVNITR